MFNTIGHLFGVLCINLKLTDMKRSILFTIFNIVLLLVIIISFALGIKYEDTLFFYIGVMFIMLFVIGKLQ